MCRHAPGSSAGRARRRSRVARPGAKEEDRGGRRSAVPNVAIADTRSARGDDDETTTGRRKRRRRRTTTEIAASATCWVAVRTAAEGRTRRRFQTAAEERAEKVVPTVRPRSFSVASPPAAERRTELPLRLAPSRRRKNRASASPEPHLADREEHAGGAAHDLRRHDDQPAEVVAAAARRELAVHQHAPGGAASRDEQHQVAGLVQRPEALENGRARAFRAVHLRGLPRAKPRLVGLARLEPRGQVDAHDDGRLYLRPRVENAPP